MNISEIWQWVQENGYPKTAEDYRKAYAEIEHRGYQLATLYQEMEMQSRFVDAHRDISFGGATVQLHSHRFFELLHCLSDSGTEYLVGTSRYVLQKGDIVLIPPETSRRPLKSGISTVPYEREVIWLSRELLDMLTEKYPSALEFPGENHYLLRTSGTRWEYLCRIFHQCVVETQERVDGWEMAVFGNAMQLLSLCDAAAADRREKSSGGGFHSGGDQPSGWVLRLLQLLPGVSSGIQGLAQPVPPVDSGRREESFVKGRGKITVYCFLWRINDIPPHETL